MDINILILAVIIGCIPGYIAQKKGHDFVTWWIFGAALFIVALPASIMLKPRDPRAPERSHESEQQDGELDELYGPRARGVRYDPLKKEEPEQPRLRFGPIEWYHKIQNRKKETS